MQLGKLRSVIAAMLERDISEFQLADGTDLLNLAINNAQRVAQNSHDFERSKVLVDLVIDEVAGGDLDTAYLHGGSAEDDVVEINTIMEIGVWNSVNTDICARPWVTYDELKVRIKAQSGDLYDPEFRYPSDATATSMASRAGFVVRGNSLFLASPGTAGTTQTIGLYVSRYFGDVPDGEEYGDFENWLMKKGGTWLQWQTIIELNHLNKHFVYRQEGNLPPPEKMAAAAWDALLKADCYQFNKLPEGHL